MKIQTQVLAFCLLQPVAAFFVQGPKTFDATSSLRSSSYFQEGGLSPTSTGIANPTPKQYDAGPLASGPRIPSSKNIWREESTTLIQGNTLRTWPLSTSMIDMVQLSMATEGRPLNANVELWQGPDYTPMVSLLGVTTSIPNIQSVAHHLFHSP
jgi:hypothetical protein